MLVGVIRTVTRFLIILGCCPHARGGGPDIALCLVGNDQFVPMLVGVVRNIVMVVLLSYCCPHARGGGPDFLLLVVWIGKRCPHHRGGGPGSQREDRTPLELSPCSWGWSDRKKS